MITEFLYVTRGLENLVPIQKTRHHDVIDVIGRMFLIYNQVPILMSVFEFRHFEF